jgi:hypothetical protein
MKQVKADADLPANANEGIEDAAFEPEDMSAAAAEAAAQTTPALCQESLAAWWTAAALVWGTPVRMWSEIVAAAWRPFLPPTALTVELPRREDTGTDRRSDAPLPAQPAPQEAVRTPRVSAPRRPVSGPARRSR